ncbi:MAG: phytoene desaturase family protein [Bacteroidota bacterium]
MIPANCQVVIIGAGYAGLAAAACLTQQGFAVTVLEKNTQPGGRARMLEEAGFRFDMGPSWYWMPDVIEAFFNRFNHTAADFYALKQLDPSYAVYFSDDHIMHIPAEPEARIQLFETYEKGSGTRLQQFLAEASYKYKVGMEKFVWKPGRSISELADLSILQSLWKLHLLQSFHQYIRKFFHNKFLLQILEFPILFLGATPQKIPALYSMMNYADIALGTWYPMGGMHEPIRALVKLNEALGTTIITQAEVQELVIKEGCIKQVHTDRQTWEPDVVIANGDYHHVEQHLLPASYRTYSETYWDSRVLTPSCLLYYLGTNRRIPNLLHHNLFFHDSPQQHFQEIYDSPRWPTNPLFYVSCTSKTDATVAPLGCENLFILIPVAPGLPDTPEIRERYLQFALQKIEALTDQKIAQHIIYQKTYAHHNFIQDYHAFKGNAYGLASTLGQTATFRPALQSKKVRNLYYTGQFTVPGPGVPPAIISGQVVAREVIRAWKR